MLDYVIQTLIDLWNFRRNAEIARTAQWWRDKALQAEAEVSQARSEALRQRFPRA